MNTYDIFKVSNNGCLELKEHNLVDVNIERKPIFYIYVYMDPRRVGNYFWDDYIFPCEPFYIGKCKNNRVVAHIDSVLKNKKDCNNLKIERIKNIIDETGYYPIYGKFIDNLYEEEAFKLERMLIKDLKGSYGCLTNIASGGVGGDTISKNPNKKEIGLKISQKTKGRSWEDLMGKEEADKRRYNKKIDDMINPNSGMKGKHHLEDSKASHGSKGSKNGMYGRGNERVGEKNTFYGKHHTDKTKKILSEKRRGKKFPMTKYECPYCHKVTAWKKRHFENCKFKGSNNE